MMNMTDSRLPAFLGDKLERLRAIMDASQRTVVAYSGGVDSALVYAVAHERLGEGAVAVTAVSPSLPRNELDDARTVAAAIGGRHILLQSQELADPRYRENTVLRCYFCKEEVFTRLVGWARENGFDVVMDGTNADDAGDHRPGRKAARDFGVRSPLVDVKLDKGEIRALAHHLGLPNADKPAAACLSSRIPYGTAVTPERLAQVEQAEGALRRLGLAHLRVRHHGDIARIEVAPEDFPRVLAARERLVAEIREVGFLHVSLDLAGYRHGSLNERLHAPHGPGSG